MSPEIAREPSNPVGRVDGPETPGSAPGGRTVGRESASCSGCDSRWTGANRAHCGVCHRTFAGVGQFDLHRGQDGEHGSCLDPASVTDKRGTPRMSLRDGLWRGPEVTEEQRQILKNLRPTRTETDS